MNLETSKWVEYLIKHATKISISTRTRAQRRMLADWIRDDCATRKMPSAEVEAELEKHGLKK